jgi:hypothetical protein
LGGGCQTLTASSVRHFTSNVEPPFIHWHYVQHWAKHLLKSRQAPKAVQMEKA